MEKKLPNSVFTIILSAITLVSWVIFSIYQALRKPLPVVVSPEIIQPVDPNINFEILEKIKNKNYFEEESFNFNETNIQLTNQTSKTEESPSNTMEIVRDNENINENENSD